MGRVVVTVISGVTSFGNDYESITKTTCEYKNAVQYMPEWGKFEGMHTNCAAQFKL